MRNEKEKKMFEIKQKSIRSLRLALSIQIRIPNQAKNIQWLSRKCDLGIHLNGDRINFLNGAIAF